MLQRDCKPIIISKKNTWRILLLKCKGVNYSDFLKSEYWMKIRKIIFTRDGHKCTKCNSNISLMAHHTTYKYHFSEHKHLDTLITLCERCHKKEHGK